MPLVGSILRFVTFNRIRFTYGFLRIEMQRTRPEWPATLPVRLYVGADSA